MGDKSKIEWCDATWNPIVGCSKATMPGPAGKPVLRQGCANCYAIPTARRCEAFGIKQYAGLTVLNNQKPEWAGKIKVVDHLLDQPLRWRKPRRIFVNSESDLFHEKLSVTVIARVFATMAIAQEHTFIVLTKRPERMQALLSDNTAFDEEVAVWVEQKAYELSPCLGHLATDLRDGTGCPLKNVQLMVSIEDQASADYAVPLLLQTPAAVRGVSAEPLLGPVELKPSWTAGYDYSGGYKVSAPRLDWVIVGGESGPKARPIDLTWVRALRDQCKAAGVPYFFKQWGAWLPGEGDGKRPAHWQDGERGTHSLADRDSVLYHKFGEWSLPGTFALKVGKKRAGRLLDGKEYSQFPKGPAK